MLSYRLTLNSGAEVEVIWPDHSLLEAMQAADRTDLTKVVVACHKPRGEIIVVDVREVAVMRVAPLGDVATREIELPKR
jgi:hypothetical protein